MNFSYQTRQGLGVDRDAKATAWWCPSCSLLVTQVKNPILCDECDGDMTIAPERFQTNSPQAKDHAS